MLCTHFFAKCNCSLHFYGCKLKDLQFRSLFWKIKVSKNQKKCKKTDLVNLTSLRNVSVVKMRNILLALQYKFLFHINSNDLFTSVRWARDSMYQFPNFQPFFFVTFYFWWRCFLAMPLASTVCHFWTIWHSSST